MQKLGYASNSSSLHRYLPFPGTPSTPSAPAAVYTDSQSSSHYKYLKGSGIPRTPRHPSQQSNKSELNSKVSSSKYVLLHSARQPGRGHSVISCKSLFLWQLAGWLGQYPPQVETHDCWLSFQKSGHSIISFAYLSWQLPGWVTGQTPPAINARSSVVIPKIVYGRRRGGGRIGRRRGGW